MNGHIVGPREMSGVAVKHNLNKVRVSLFLGVSLTVLCAASHVVVFIVVGNYSWLEIRHIWLYFLHYQMTRYALFFVPGSVFFALGWRVSDRFEGFAIAAFCAGLVMVPVTYWANKHFLPGIRELQSILGNAGLAVIAVVMTWLLYIKLTRHVRILGKLYSPSLLVVLLLVFVGAEAVYFLRPVSERFQKGPARVREKLLDLLDFQHGQTDGFDRTSEAAGREGEAVLAYFSRRTPAVRREIRERIAKLYPDTTEIISRADAILRREFTLWDVTKRLPREIDWYKNPTKDKIWLFALNEFEWLWDVVAAYVLTGDEKYARDFEAIMEDFLDRVPTIPWKNERDPVWRLIGVGLRMSGSWVDAFYVFLPSRAVKPETKLRMLSAIYHHAQFLAHFRSPSLNHLIQESYGLLKVGAMFPEFRMASTWVEIAVKRLDWDVTVDVYPDGGYTEASTFYHRYVIRLLQTILEFSEGHKVALTQNFYRQLEKMYDFLLYTARPDGRMPQVNDGFHAKVLRKLFRRPAAQFRRQDYVYLATDGKEGTAPDRISVGFPYTGLYVMRSDWSHDARYLLFDGGLFGSAHGHEDKLSFELFAFGRPFIVEAGTYTYVYNKWHKYFESSFAHNTVVVDRKSQLRFFDKKRWVTKPHRTLPNSWISNDDFDFIESRYNRGYGNVKEKIDKSVSHIRRILFVKPDYWVLWDVLKGKGKHLYEQLFHFAPSQLRVLESKAVITQNDDSANLLLHPLFTQGLTVRQEIGREDPIQGWISPKYGEKEPAPAVVFSKKGTVPVTFVDVLFPLRKGQAAEDVSVTALPLYQDRKALPETEGIVVKVTTPGGQDYIMIAPGHRGKKTFADFVATGEVLVMRTTPDGKVEKRSEADL